MTSMIERVAQILMQRVNAPEQDIYSAARTAIQAMRDPTPEMIAAMAKDIGPLRLMWIAAIDAALNETE